MMNKKTTLTVRIIFCLFLVTTIVLSTSCKKDKHTHEWEDATCLTPKKCKTCGEIEGTALGHQKGAFKVVANATCISEGLEQARCTRCNELLEENAIAKSEHDLEHHEALEATCITVGHIAYDTCKNCDYTTYQEIAKSEHDLEYHEALDATCTTAGHTAYDTCKNCDYTTYQEIAKLDHDLEHHEALDATCTTAGHTAYDTCKNCDYTTYQEIAAGHVWNDATTESEKVCSLCGTINIPVSTSKNISLPNIYNGETIIWTSSDHAGMLDDGTIVASNVKRNITLEASYTFNGEVLTKQYEVEIKPITVDEGKYKYAFDYYKGKLTNDIGKDVKLTTKAYNGFNVKYESLDEDVITSTGVINQTIRDQFTTMNIYIIKDGVAVLYSIDIKVIAYSSIQRVDFAKPIVDQLIEDFQNGKVDTLPVTIEQYEVDLKWSSNIPEMIVLGNMVLTPMEKTDIELKCTIVHGTSKFIKEYSLKQVGGTISKELYIQKLLEAFSRVELKGSINHLYDQYNTGELYLHHQERTNSGGVLNLFNTNSLNVDRSRLVDVKAPSSSFKSKFFGSGTFGTYKPAVPQSILDAKMYPGYQMPNKENVLWVVVHESAMTIAGQDAKLLADIQYRYAFQQENARAASWNYQVDAYSIYQSFEDDVICWHAGDGTATAGTGNNNGIGIEMCVNRDGNYEGTLHNNAKLVASFMLRYNLNIDNVKRHYDMSGKECPSYLIRTNRWEEFVEMVRLEYLLQKYLSNAEIKYELSTTDCATTNDVLAKYFIEGTNGLWYNKAVNDEVNVNFKVTVKLEGKTYTASSIIDLLPNEVSNG